jgi:hypothetical protein
MHTTRKHTVRIASGPPPARLRRGLSPCMPQPRSIIRAPFVALTALGLALLAAPHAHAQNLVTNPGFETGDFTGYTSSGPVGIDTAAHTGNFSAEFNGINTFGDLSQSIATTAGKTYNISFFLMNNGGPNNEFKASFAGFQGVDVVNANGFAFTQFNFTAVATGPTSLLQFDAFQNPSRFRLDDISVTVAPAVPEASTTVSLGLLLALGLSGLVVSARRRKANPTL